MLQENTLYIREDILYINGPKPSFSILLVINSYFSFIEIKTLIKNLLLNYQ